MRGGALFGRRLWLGLSIVASVVLTCSFLWWGLGKVVCDDYVGAMVPAPAPTSPRYPNNTPPIPDYAAYVWSRNCGATTSYNTIVYPVQPRDHWPDHQDAVLESAFEPTAIQLHWDSHTQLVIEYVSPWPPTYRKLIAQLDDVTIILRAHT